MPIYIVDKLKPAVSKDNASSKAAFKLADASDIQDTSTQGDVSVAESLTLLRTNTNYLTQKAATLESNIKKIQDNVSELGSVAFIISGTSEQFLNSNPSEPEVNE